MRHVVCMPQVVPMQGHLRHALCMPQVVPMKVRCGSNHVLVEARPPGVSEKMFACFVRTVIKKNRGTRCSHPEIF